MRFKSPVTKLKRQVAKTTGIPTTKTGWSGKLNRLTGGVSAALSGKGRSIKTKGRRMSVSSRSKTVEAFSVLRSYKTDR